MKTIGLFSGVLLLSVLIVSRGVLCLLPEVRAQISVRPVRRHQSKWITSRDGPKYSGGTEPKRTFAFDVRPKFPGFLAKNCVFPVVASLPVRLLVRRLRSHGLHSRPQILHFVWSRRFKTNSTGDENIVTQVNRAKPIFGLPEALTFVTSENTLLFVLYVHLQNSFLQQKRFVSELSFLRQN